MQKGLAISFLVLVVALCPAQRVLSQALPPWNDDTRNAWWAKNPTPNLWPRAAGALQAQLEADYKQNGARVFSNPYFQGWLDHLEWIRLGLDCPDVLADPAQLKTFIVLGRDETVSHLFVEKLDPDDIKEQALKNLIRLSEATAADLHEYAALGVAYSLVFDEPFPDDWPHAQVSHDAVPIGDLDIVKRFQFYVQSNRAGKLDLNPTRLSFENLKYLVDSEVKLSELEYAQKNRIPYSGFADAFFSIQYDHSRISNMKNGSQTYNWPNPSYALADILDKGGICIDQAYYAEMIGKGRGIPTIRFDGYGVDGAHSWFGYMTSSGKWDLDCGRYEDQAYPKGFAVDPQTWRPIDDSVLQNIFKNGATNPDYQPAMTALAWARLHAGAASYPHILDDARAIMPEWSGTWRLQARLVDAGGDLGVKKAFYQDWINQFGNYPEMKVEGQKRLYLALKAADDPDADGVLKDIILQNRSEGFDLGIAASAETINEKLKAGDWDGARLVYERTVRDFGQEGGLTLYRKVVDPYITACLQNDKLDLARRAVTFTQDRMSINKDSQVDSDFTDLKNEVDGAASKSSGR
ncbi:MAG TPA: hypothetical protein VGZ93_09775 [Candidatus Methylacidiphilales bacterium]|jgi:hypothetical protein|nr:hypothetical protein [Candidatus Methylacidiphilales bacterium]